VRFGRAAVWGLAVSVFLALWSVPAPSQQARDQDCGNFPRTSPTGNGPGGASPANVAGYEFSDRELAEFRSESGRYSAALVMHYLSSNWSRLQVEGMRDLFAAAGVPVIAVTGAGFNAEQQVLDLERVIAARPDIIVSIPVNPRLEGPVYKKIGRKGIELVLLDLLPRGLRHPRDYASLVASTNRSNGALAADMLARHLGGSGRIGVMQLAFAHRVTEERLAGFEQRLADRYPGVRVVSRGEFSTVKEAYLTAEEMLAADPELAGMYVVWIEPAMQVVRAAKRMGRTPSDFAVTTSDLEPEGAQEIAAAGFIKGTVAQDAYAQGQTAAMMSLRAAAGQKTPPYLAIPGIPVTRDNVVEAYRCVLRRSPPEELVRAAAR
jgi:ribose transport system substrate-binding protein